MLAIAQRSSLVRYDTFKTVFGAGKDYENMSVKKFFISLSVALILLTSAVGCYAAEVSIISAKDNVISVKGGADAYEYVTLTIMNPGYAAADIGSGDLTGAVQYFKGERAGLDGFSFTVKLYDTTVNRGGDFTVLVTVGDVPLEPMNFTFYFYEKKMDILAALNSASKPADITAMLADCYASYSLNNHELVKGGNMSTIADCLFALRNAEASGLFPEDTDAIYNTLQTAALIAAFNDSKVSLLVENGMLKYTDSLLNLAGTQEYTDYAGDLTSTGRGAFNSALIGGAYASIADITTAFKELTAYYGIAQNKNLGYGHIDHYLTSYNDIYIKYGFELSKLTAATKIKVYNDLLSARTANLTEMARVFNLLVKADSPAVSRPTGGSGGGGGSSVPNVKVVSEPAMAYAPAEPVDVSFSDLGDFSWAREAIQELALSGAVSGKGAGLFAPGDSVTREEFVKIVVSVMRLDITAAQEHSFEDVTNDWSRGYIAAAVNAGIINGVSDTSFAPGDNITREQGAAVLHRALTYMSKVLPVGVAEFDDDGDISDWAKESVYGLRSAGIISGKDNNSFAPLDFMNRAEAAKMIYGITLID